MGITVTIRTNSTGNTEPEFKTLEPILKVESLWKTYRSGKVEVPALRGVNLRFSG